ncbi:FAS1-like dehydratase domain-containing protein [Paracoccus seriniphilus]|uniref:3-methylfumaryl-CoA hydratase n=1 Tax=Paracoccus seriniphilus TaxID=184748 RepID=A0A239Q2A4_9RHOB|nr:MaoC family dehydratase N-terminal domain-containing protein [Paracoccus seriniphilus]WCR15601.1 MaoC family dehydratase N-terminal domain-containing protein [Paracoccus seriniphilus]SNT76625.1 3-methylfumaryl-CoA hydratase [Paracoccus seriniphilus]
MVTTPELDLDHLRSWIGREEQQSELLTPMIVQRLLATLDREGPTENGAIAPLLVHHCLCQFPAPTAALGPDGHPPRGGFLPPIPLPRRMWAGGELAFKSDAKVGDVITRNSVIDDVTLKHGRSGRLCFVTITHRFSSAGRELISERQDIVYRDISPSRPGASSSLPAAPEGSEQSSISMSAERLFRYSALTFNSHRIHYDVPYATGEEGYPGLVVHGPLQAMLLAQYAQDLQGPALRRFRFRSHSPVFGGGALLMNAHKVDGGLDLWTASPDGPIAMQARAEW